MTTESADLGHGHSPAAWTAVTIMLVAFTVGTTAFFFVVTWLVWVSFVVLLAGPIAGYAMARAGYGVAGIPAATHH
jgi:succinate-acetate transporter protein